jgi:magnesium chelatase family protein
MSVARLLSRTQLGLAAPLVQVEVHLSAGLPGFAIVGLPEPVVRESRERVRAALLSCGYVFPLQRITVNLAPAEIAKQGGRFDLPIALGLLVASGQLQPDGDCIECYGELGLNGELRGVSGLFLAALQARRERHALVVPQANAAEVRLSGHRRIYAVAHLRAAAEVLAGHPRVGSVPVPTDQEADAARNASASEPPALRLEEVAGQWQAKRALLVAAAGAHGLLMVGPPGSGKSMLAARLPALLPPLSTAEALEVASLQALAGLSPDPKRWRERPFRSPHHTSSAHALVGGGSSLSPGEISLAHHGVLFLDELPEFDRRVLESLREPLDSGSITLARARGRLQLPARFQLVAAMNPCPCGFLGDSRVSCRCSPARVRRYRERLSGPLLDRIDIRITVARLEEGELAQAAGIALTAAADSVHRPESSQVASAQVLAARQRRLQRSGALCAHLPAAELRRCCTLTPPAEHLLRRSCQQLSLSGRGLSRLLALARTIADLADSDPIELNHLAEAIQLHRALSPGDSELG